MTSFIIPVQEPFDFQQCLIFLKRSKQEVMHVTTDESVRKLFDLGDRFVLVELKWDPEGIEVLLFEQDVSEEKRIVIEREVRDWLDLDRDLQPFEQLAQQDDLLRPIFESYRGLRLIGFPDLFEALTWAIIGQQITLSFAYTLKRRFVEQYGESQTIEGVTYWTFPRPEVIATLEPEALRPLQFSYRKAEYIRDIAREIVEGTLSKMALRQLSTEDIRKHLLQLRGVGEWTADYVLMKCFQEPSAFPVADAGLHQALMYHLGLSRKPTQEEVKRYGAQWEGWEGYATFYLWRSLYGNV